MTETWMPDIEVYMAVAEVLHDKTEQWTDTTFAECPNRDLDIEEAFQVLRALRSEGWQVVRDPAGTAELGL